MRGTVAIVGLVTLGACTDPRVEVRLVFPPKGPGALTALEDDLHRIDVTVAVLADRACAAVEDGTVTPEELALGRRTTARLDRGATGFTEVALTDVPRLDAKVFVVTGYDRQGDVIAGGCQDVVAIEDDRLVELPVEPALITRVVPSELTTPSLRLPLTPEEDGRGKVRVIARERRSGGDLVPVGSLHTRLRDVDGERAYGRVDAPTSEADKANGLFTITGLIAGVDAVGPLELIVRGAWSDQVNRISAAVPPRRELILPLGPRDEPNTVAPSWAVLANSDGVVAAALYKAAAGTTELHVFRGPGGDALTHQPPIPAPEVRTLVTYRHDDMTAPVIVSRLSTGWVQLRWQADPPTAMRLTSETTVAADQLVALPPCGSTSLGLIVGTGATYTGYADLVASPATPGQDIARIAAAFTSLASDGAILEPLGTACLTTSVGSSTPVVAVRATRDGRATVYLVTPDLAPFATDFVGAVGAVALENRVALLAATRTATGVRVQSYRLKYEGAMPMPQLIPDGLIDHPLPDVPRALVALLANQDDYLDTVAVEALPSALGLSMTLGAAVAGDELSAMTTVEVVGTDQSLRPVKLSNNGPGLLILGSSALATYDLRKAM